MQISTDFFQTLNAAGIDLSSAFAWFDADVYDPSYRQVLDNPIGLETLQMEYLHFKVTYVNAIIRSNASADSLVIWAGEIRLIDDYPAGASGNYQPLNSTLTSISALSNSLGWLRNDGLGGLSWNQSPLNLTVGVNADTLPAITDNGSGSITVASTTCNLKSSTTGIVEIITYNIASVTLTVSANATYYLCISYNAGSPIYYIEGNKYNINDSTICAVYALWYVSGKVYYQPFGNNGKSLSNKINYSISNTQPYKLSIAGGLLISESSLAIAATGAIVYAGTNPISLSSFTSASNSLIPVYNSSSTWTYGSAVTAYDSTYYDPGTNRATIPNSKYAVRWYYRAVDTNNTSIYYVYGSNYYNTVDTANAETPRTDLPQFILEYCILIGKSIVQYGATSGLTYSIFNTQYSASLSGSYLPLSGGTLTGDLTTVNIVPSASTTYDLGSSSYYWNNLYLTKLILSDGNDKFYLYTEDVYTNTSNYNMNVIFGLADDKDEYGSGGQALTIRCLGSDGSTNYDIARFETGSTSGLLRLYGDLYLPSLTLYTIPYISNSSGLVASLSTGTSGYVLVSGGSSAAPSWTSLSSIGLSGSGTANYIPKWSSASVLTNSSIYDDGSNVYSGESFLPTTTSVFNLGSSSYIWNILYGNILYAYQTLTLNGTGKFYWDSAANAYTYYSSGNIVFYNNYSGGYIFYYGSTELLRIKSGNNIISNADFIPYATSSYNLGSSSLCWNNIYGNYVYAANAAMATWTPSSSFAWFGYSGLNNNTNGNAGFLHHSNGNAYVCGISSVNLQVSSANKISLDSNINAYANILPNATATYNLGSSSLYWNSTFSNYYYGKYAGIDTAYFSSNATYASFGHKACTSKTNFCLLQDSSGNSWLNGASQIELQISNTAIARLYSTGFVPYKTSTFNLGSSSYYWNNTFSNCYYAKYAGIDVGYYSSGSNGYASFGNKSCMSNTNFCLLHSSTGDSYLNGYSFISFQIANNEIMVLHPDGLLPVNSSVRDLGSSSYYWNNLYCNTINCNAINSSSAITVSGGIISYTYNESATMTPTDATGNIVEIGAYYGLTTITLSIANISVGKIIEFHNSSVNSCRFVSPNGTIKIHYSTANIVTYAAGTTSATIAVNLICRVVRVGAQFDITVS